MGSPYHSTIHAPEFRAPLVESAQEVSPEELPREDQLCKLDPLMKQSRVAEGMLVRKLAQETRIATAVIEALERGSADRLPEHAYLSSMLPQLERRLVPTPGVFYRSFLLLWTGICT